MTYLIIQVLSLLVAATVLGFAIGWLIRAFNANRVENKLNDELNRSSRSIPPLKEALSRAQADTEDRENMISALRETLGQRQNALEDALHTQRAIETQRDQIEEQMALTTSELERTNREQSEEAEQRYQTLQTEMDDERERMLKELQGKESALTHANDESDRLKSLIDQLRESSEEFQEGNAQRDDEIERLNQSLLQADELKGDLEIEISKLRQALADTETQLQTRVADLTDAVNIEKAFLDSARDTVARGEAKLELLDEQMKDRGRELERMEAQAKHQNNAFEKLQLQYMAARSEQASRETENTGKIAKLEDELDRQKDLLEKAESQIRADTRSRDKLQDDLNRLHKEMREASNAGQEKENHLTAELEKNRAVAAKAVSDADNVVVGLKKKLEQAKENAKKDRKDISVLQKALEKEHQEHKESQGQLIAEVEKDNKVQERKINALEREVSAGKAATSEARKEVEQQKALAAEKLENEKDKVQVKLDSAKEKLAEERGRFKEEMLAGIKSAEKLEKELKAQKNKVAALERTLDADKANHDKVVQKLVASEQKAKDKTADEKENAQIKVDILKDKLNEERNRNKEVLNAEKKNANQLEGQLKAQIDKVDQLEKAFAKSENELANAAREIEVLEQKNSEDAQREKEKAQAGIDLAKDKLEDERQQFKETLEKQQNALDKADDDKNSLQDAVGTLEKSLVQEKLKLEKAAQKLTAIEQVGADKVAYEKDKAQAKIETLNDKLAEEKSRKNKAESENRSNQDKLDLANGKLEQADKDLNDAKLQEEKQTRQIDKLSDALEEQRLIVAEIKAEKQNVDDALKDTVTELKMAEKSGTEARAQADAGKIQLDAFERDLARANQTLDSLHRKLDDREKAIEVRTRERDQYGLQIQGMKDQLKEMKDQIADLSITNEILEKDQKKNELGWQEKITKQSSIEADLRAHIKKLEALVSAELRNARQGILTRIGDMEAALDIESQRVDELDKKAKDKVVTIVERKVS